ncbi:MAG: helix-turn-helix domain-containing protein [Erysipelotrichales bacterium]|nr:helix-turn-helix domain-containing protein [Erysipelotrichales bacterium]
MRENKFDIKNFVDVETEQAVITELVKRVKLRRKDLGISQQLLATRSGVSYGSVRRFESTGDISLTSLLKIGEALEALSDFNQLFKGRRVKSLKDLKL